MTPPRSSDAVRKAIDEGRYHAALGVSVFARRIDIEAAGGRLEGEFPDLARSIGGIVQILTNTEKQRIFGIALAFRDTAMQELRRRFGSWIDDERNGALANVWTAVKFFLRFDGETGEAKIGPRAAESLVRNAMPWVTEQVINTTCFIVEADPYELAQGYCVRRINYRWCPRCERNGKFPCPACDAKGYFPAQERERDILVLTEPDLAPVVQEYKGEPCQNCKGTGRLDCDCEDDYQYSIPTGTKPGSVLEGTGLRTGNRSYAILSPPVYTPRPQ